MLPPIIHPLYVFLWLLIASPNSKVHGAHMGPTWGRQDPGGPHVVHVNLAIWVHQSATQQRIV